MFKKAYGIFSENTDTGTILGYIENSFSMGWSATHVRAWWKNSDAEYHLNKMLKRNPDRNIRYFIVRISGESEIQVNLARGTDKFSSRNKRFHVRKTN